MMLSCSSVFGQPDAVPLRRLDGAAPAWVNKSHRTDEPVVAPRRREPIGAPAKGLSATWLKLFEGKRNRKKTQSACACAGASDLKTRNLA